jgi:hypothetical protein
MLEKMGVFYYQCAECNRTINDERDDFEVCTGCDEVYCEGCRDKVYGCGRDECDGDIRCGHAGTCSACSKVKGQRKTVTAAQLINWLSAKCGFATVMAAEAAFLNDVNST